MQGIARKSRVVGFDLVEVNPFVDMHGHTSLPANTLIAEILGAVFEQRAGSSDLGVEAAQ